MQELEGTAAKVTKLSPDDAVTDEPIPIDGISRICELDAGIQNSTSSTKQASEGKPAVKVAECHTRSRSRLQSTTPDLACPFLLEKWRARFCWKMACPYYFLQLLRYILAGPARYLL